MPFVEQNPLSVISLATLPERLPEQVMIGIESSKLLSSTQSDGTNLLIRLEDNILKASPKRLSLILKAS